VIALTFKHLQDDHFGSVRGYIIASVEREPVALIFGQIKPFLVSIGYSSTNAEMQEVIANIAEVLVTAVDILTVLSDGGVDVEALAKSGQYETALVKRPKGFRPSTTQWTS
jgi:hypothetical protein